MFPAVYYGSKAVSLFSGEGSIKEILKFGLSINEEGEIGKLIKNKIESVYDLSKKVIVFDDLERHSEKLSIKDILGYINNLVENKKSKVIVVCNKENEPEANTAFAIYQEKSIRYCYNYEPDLNSVITGLIKSYSNEFLNNNIDDLLKPFSIAKCNNIRTVSLVLELFDELWKAIKEDSFNDKNTILKIVYMSLAVFTIEYKKNSKFNELSVFNNDTELHWDLAWDSKNDQSQDTIDSTIDYSEIAILLKNISPVFEYVKNGVLNKDSMVDCLRIYDPTQVDRKDVEDFFYKISNPWYIEDSEYKEYLKKYYDYLNEMSINEIMRLVTHFEWHEINKINGFEIKKDLPNFLMNIKNALDKKLTFELTNNSQFDMYIDNVFKDSNELRKDIIQHIKDFIRNLKSQHEKEVVDGFYSMLENNKDLELKDFMKESNRIIISSLDEKKVCNALFNANRATKIAFARGCHVWFPYNLTGDSVNIQNKKEALWQEIQKRLLTGNITTENFVLKQLKFCLGNGC